MAIHWMYRSNLPDSPNMRFFDYHFTVDGDIFELDEEFNINSTDWQEGDVFKLELTDNTNSVRFVRLSKLEKFIIDNGE